MNATKNFIARCLARFVGAAKTICANLSEGHRALRYSIIVVDRLMKKDRREMK
jgi:hypothetical protein